MMYTWKPAGRRRSRYLRRKQRAPPSPTVAVIHSIPEWGFGAVLCDIKASEGHTNISVDIKIKLESETPRLLSAVLHVNGEAISAFSATANASAKISGAASIFGTRRFEAALREGDIVQLKTYARMSRPLSRECAIDDSRLEVSGEVTLT